MKVLHISYCDDGEGAAIAASRLCEALIESGVDSKILVKRKVGGKPFVIKATRSISSNALSWIKTGLDMLLSKAICCDRSIYFSLPILSSFRITSEVNNADIIHLHWINRGFLSLFDLYKLSRQQRPIFVTMHDNWYFTAGCHMVGQCDGFITGCKRCPISRAKTLTSIVAKLKKRIIGCTKNIHFIAISEQMRMLSESSHILEKAYPIYLPNCVNTEIFKPHNKQLCRSVFDLPSDKKIILFLISSDPRKGMEYVINLMHDKLYANGEYLFVGYGSETLPDEIKNQSNVKVVGRLRDPHSLALIYSSVDVLLSPSTEEPFGLTHIESMACGTPTVGFDDTGSSSIIEHMTTGYLAKYKNKDDLKVGLNYSLTNFSALSAASRDAALKRFSYGVVAKMVIAQYIKFSTLKDHA
jgi:glycosyltransferase involved in cell wall biosynthesis